VATQTRPAASGDALTVDSMQRLLDFEAVLDGVFRRFSDLDVSEFDAAVDDALAAIGSFVGVDRAYIIVFDDVAQLTWMTHEWCGPGIDPTFEFEQGRPYADAPREQECLSRFEVNEIRDVAALADDWAEDRAYLMAEGITAILEVPLVRGGALVGVIGFDSVTGAVPWTTEDVTVLKAVAVLFAQVTARRTAGDSLAVTEADLAQAVDALQHSEARFERLVDQLPLAVYRFDRRGRLITANRLAAQEPIDLLAVGQVLDGPPSSDRAVDDPIVSAVCAAIESGEPHRVEVSTGSGDRRIRHEVTVTPERSGRGEVVSVLLVSHDITARYEYEQQLAHAATHDALTGLPNRALFDVLLEQAAERIVADGLPVAALFVDLDAFKDVNDSFGHAAGDALLVDVAARLRAALPAVDGVARLGGDEFAVLLHDHDEVSASGVADLVLAAFAEPFESGGETLVVGASIGVAVGRDPAGVLDLLRSSDIAMYRAKRRGRNGYAVYDRALSDEVLERLRIDQWLRRAVELDEITVAYQPVVDLVDGRIRGVEALVRWCPGGGEPTLASEFIPIAEENGTIHAIGRSVLREACATVAAWHAEGVVAPDFALAVNVSARQLDRSDLVDEITSALAQSGLDPHTVWLEVTETALIADHERAVATLAALRRTGIRVSIDDFGTGYGSLGLLQQLPVDALKIDRSFVGRLLEDRGADAITGTVLALATAFGLEVVAEGIERPEQRDRLRSMGCSLGQGYLFSRPVFADELESRFLAT